MRETILVAARPFHQTRFRISPESFAQFRRDELGPLVAGLQTRLDISRYVQTHRDPASADAERAFLALRPGAGNEFDGIEEYWWPDEASCCAALGNTRGAYAEIEALACDWLDAGASPAWLAVDYPQVATSTSRMVAAPKSGIVRLAFAIAPPPHLGFENAQRYWLTQHGPIVRSFAAARGTLAYNQVHRMRNGADTTLSAIGLLSAGPHLGHAEAWFSEAPPSLGADGLAARQAAIADEQRFIDWPCSSVLIGKELVFVDRTWI